MTDELHHKQIGLYHSIMIALYNHSTPQLNWAVFMDNATDEELKEFNYMDYYLDDETFNKIVDQHLKISKLPKRLKEQVRTSVYLGPSPTSVKK